jgi:hypothetical protein
MIMARRTTLASVGAGLIGLLIVVMVMRSTQGQSAAMRVQGFPFIEIGQTYSTGIHEFQVIQDIGNGWIIARSVVGRTMLVNLNQMTVLYPRD